MLSKINENISCSGSSSDFIKLKPSGKQCLIIESSNEIVSFSKGGKYDIIFGCNSCFLFNSSKVISLSYNQPFLYIEGSTPISTK